MSLTKTRYMMVAEFNKKVLKIMPRPLGVTEGHEAALSVRQLIEEAEELAEAVADKDLVNAIDAVIDSIYFAYGIMYKMGVTEEMLDNIFSIVHNSNMMKKKGVKKGREGFDAADANKPTSWEAPEDKIKRYLNGLDSKTL